jgi:hypothetical protein
MMLVEALRPELALSLSPADLAALGLLLRLALLLKLPVEQLLPLGEPEGRLLALCVALLLPETEGDKDCGAARGSSRQSRRRCCILWCHEVRRRALLRACSRGNTFFLLSGPTSNSAESHTLCLVPPVNLWRGCTNAAHPLLGLLRLHCSPHLPPRCSPTRLAQRSPRPLTSLHHCCWGSSPPLADALEQLLLLPASPQL